MRWMNDSAFRTELERVRNNIADLAYTELEGLTLKSVFRLAQLLDHETRTWCSASPKHALHISQHPREPRPPPPARSHRERPSDGKAAAMRNAVRRSGAGRAAAQPAGGVGVSPTTCWAGGEGGLPHNITGGWEELHPPENRVTQCGPVCGGDREGAVIPAKAGTQVSTSLPPSTPTPTG